MASTYLTRNTGQAGTSGKKFTISFWVKFADDNDNVTIFSASSNSTSSPFMLIQRNSSSQLRFDDYTNDTTVRASKYPKMRFRDTNAWYHIVYAIDTDQSTAANRNRIYVNGVEQTEFESSANTNYSSGATTSMGQNNEMVIGRYEPYNSNNFNGTLSHFHYCDGQQYAASDFGLTDSTTGEWKIKTSPSVTYGTNGFFILKDGNSVTDQSGNSNNFTVSGGTLTKTEDCPSNIFCTWNTLNPQATVSFSNGSNTATITDNHNAAGTLGAKTGKYYYEVKHVNKVGNGWIREDDLASLGSNRNGSSVWLSFSNFHGTIYHSGNSDTTPPSGSNGDIVGCAIDFDNGKIYWHVNGTYISTSGGQQNPATEANPITFTVGDKNWLPAVGAYSSDAVAQANFGNGYFGTTAVSSAGTNASGIGIFEYDVPTGYTALSTKGFNT